MHHYNTYRNAVGIVFPVNIISFGTNYDANLEIMSCQVILSTATYIKIPRITGEYRSRYIFLRASRLSRAASIHVHVEVLNGLTNNNSQ